MTTPRKRWSRPADLTAQVRKLYDSGRILADRLGEGELFPYRLQLKRPRPAELNDRFNDVRDWVTELVAGDREHRGCGYRLEFRTVNHRVHGANTLPAAAFIDRAEDALALIGRVRAAETFDRIVSTACDEFPALEDWFRRRPIHALEHADDWPRLLAVLRWFRDHPRPGIYLRELDIEGVDSKFIEQRRRLIAELLDTVLPADRIDLSATGARGFERRYGLRQRPARVRFRILDPRLAIAGLDDLAVPAEQFARLDPAATTVFITENEVNGLAFPPHPGSIVIFGLGYGLDRLAGIDWLADRRVFYWGDIDTHGFAILDRLRRYLPAARSFLMDRATLDAHRKLWGQEPAEHRYTGDLARLDDNERLVFETLRENTLGERLRLEQERIRFGWLRAFLDNLPTANRGT